MAPTWRNDWKDEEYVNRLVDAHDQGAIPLYHWLHGRGIPSRKAGRLAAGIVPWRLHNARSPIEELFYVAICGPAFMLDVHVSHESIGFKPYLPDFALDRATPKPDEDGFDEELLIVELDGHQFHEKTPEQAEHDRKRDRWFAANGYRVIRFTGREVWRDVRSCVAEALAFFPPLDDQTEEA